MVKQDYGKINNMIGNFWQKTVAFFIQNVEEYILQYTKREVIFYTAPPSLAYNKSKNLQHVLNNKMKQEIKPDRSYNNIKMC